MKIKTAKVTIEFEYEINQNPNHTLEDTIERLRTGAAKINGWDIVAGGVDVVWLDSEVKRVYVEVE